MVSVGRDDAMVILTPVLRLKVLRPELPVSGTWAYGSPNHLGVSSPRTTLRGWRSTEIVSLPWTTRSRRGATARRVSMLSKGNRYWIVVFLAALSLGLAAQAAAQGAQSGYRDPREFFGPRFEGGQDAPRPGRP